MPHVLVTLFCPDRTGLVAAVTGRMFELGADLGDTNFAVLGGGAEFSTVCRIPDTLAPHELRDSLRALPELDGGEVDVQPFGLSPDHGPAGQVTHVVEIAGGDRPGLIARLSEVFGQYRANIVRLDARRTANGDARLYVIRFSVSIPDRVDACLNTVANTAEELALTCGWQAV